MQRTIHTRLYPRPPQDTKNVQRGNVRQPSSIFFIPDRFKTQEMCIKALEVYLWSLEYVLDKLKVQKMCDDAVWDDAFSLVCVPNWFVTQQQLKIWHG